MQIPSAAVKIMQPSLHLCTGTELNKMFASILSATNQTVQPLLVYELTDILIDTINQIICFDQFKHMFRATLSSSVCLYEMHPQNIVL